MLKFYTVQNITQVGPSGAGKSAARSRNVLLEAMERVDCIKSKQHEIDPKVTNKEELNGTLDATTSEWTDGVSNKRHLIVLKNNNDN